MLLGSNPVLRQTLSTARQDSLPRHIANTNVITTDRTLDAKPSKDRRGRHGEDLDRRMIWGTEICSVSVCVGS